MRRQPAGPAAPGAVPHPAEGRRAVSGSVPREATAATLLAAVSAAAPFLLGWISVAANRLVSPRPVTLPVNTGTALAVALFLLACLATALLARRAALLPWAEVAAALAAVALLAATGLAAGAALDGASRLARAAPAAGVWVALLALPLAAGCCAAGRGAGLGRFAAVAALGTAALVWAGALAPLSILHEAASRGAELRAALWQHGLIAAAALALALLVALPLSALALFRPRLEAVLLGAANAVQVIPSIALFGLLMAPLAALANAWPTLRGIGLAGIGPAPAVLAIAGYLVLPIAAAALAGLRAAPAPVLDAARGMGLSPEQVLRRVRLPLGAGVILGGVRTAAVQAVGLATLAALVGGGGLGSIVFAGIGQLAADLILLGVLPVVALSLLADAVLGAWQKALTPGGGR
ncbi:ABC transporter permease [Roseomonas sp. BN140053]|uniref:ABC transporter permease n=1 Tax=Roseomonas sp. BN140053 TaxID=3391898 RepID=UPI0039E84F6D